MNDSLILGVRDILYHILSYVDLNEFISLFRCCKRIREVMKMNRSIEDIRYANTHHHPDWKVTNYTSSDDWNKTGSHIIMIYLMKHPWDKGWIMNNLRNKEVDAYELLNYMYHLSCDNKLEINKIDKYCIYGKYKNGIIRLAKSYIDISSLIIRLYNDAMKGYFEEDKDKHYRHKTYLSNLDNCLSGIYDPINEYDYGWRVKNRFQHEDISIIKRMIRLEDDNPDNVRRTVDLILSFVHLLSMNGEDD